VKITALIRYKHGDLFAVLKRLGWNQSELARRSGLTATLIGKIINLQYRPSQEIADAIQKAIGEAGEFFDVLEQWPEAFKGLKKLTTVEHTVDVPLERLLASHEALLIEAPDNSRDIELSEALDLSMDNLTDREKSVLHAIYYEGKTLDQVSAEIGVSRERIRQISQRALRKMGHPTNRRRLEVFLTAH